MPRYVDLHLCSFEALIHVLTGLDASRYRSVAGGDEHDGGSGAAPTFMALDSQMSDADRFKDAIPFRVRCKHCQAVGMWGPLWDDVRFSWGFLRARRLTHALLVPSTSHDGSTLPCVLQVYLGSQFALPTRGTD